MTQKERENIKEKLRAKAQREERQQMFKYKYRKRKQNENKPIFTGITFKNFPDPLRDTNSQIQEAQCIPNRINKKITSHKDIS